MKRIILLSFLFIQISYCSRKNPDSADFGNPVIVIDLLSEAEPASERLSAFADDIDYIPLQTTDRSLMEGSVRRVLLREKTIYLSNGKNIMCFDIEGRFLFKLDKQGRGPGEYTIIFDFDVDSDNKYLIIPNYSRLLFYGISDTGFSFQRSLAFQEPVLYKSDIIPETENIFIPVPPWKGTEQTLSLLIDIFGDTVHSKPNGYKYRRQRNGRGDGLDEMQVYSIGNKVCFKEEFSDTVFYVDAKDNLFRPRMILNSNGTIITPERRGGLENAREVRSSVNNIFETSRYVFLRSYIKDGQDKIIENRIIFDKTTNTKYILDIDREQKSALEDDLGGGPDFSIDYFNFYCSGDMLFSFIDVIALKKYIASEGFKNAKVKDIKEKERIKILADSLDEMDNPVMVVVRLKK